MNNPYDPTINNQPTSEQPQANEESTSQAETAPQNDNQSGYAGQGAQSSPYSQPYGQQFTSPYGAYSPAGPQNVQYGGYYGQPVQPQFNPQNNRPYMPAPKPKKPKSPASKGFVIGIGAITIAISLVLSLLVSLSSLPVDNPYFFSVGSDVIIQYAPKNETQVPITNKGIAAYVASVASNAVVEVTTETVETDTYYGQYITEGAGSGVIISTSDSGSYILTCAHVIEDVAKITIKLKDGTVYEADSYICDSESDVGVIKLNVKGLPVATVGQFDEVVVGEDVVAIGNPLGTLGGSVTQGIVSALDRDIIIDGTTYTLLQTNAEINPGNFGGGLFNAKGELIGIVNAKSIGENVEGLGFAIPVSNAIEIMTDLIEKGYVSGRVKLGFELFEIQSEEDITHWLKYSRYFTDYGVYIASSENSQFREGDLLVAINSDKIYSISDVKSALGKYEVGDKVTITVSRIVDNRVRIFNFELTLTEKK